MRSLGSLKAKKYKILSIDEETQRLKGKVCWLDQEDCNSKLFHKFAYTRRLINSIGGFGGSSGEVRGTQEEIEKEAYLHFKDFLQELGESSITHQLELI